MGAICFNINVETPNRTEMKTEFCFRCVLKAWYYIRMFSWFKKSFSKRDHSVEVTPSGGAPHIIPRDQHSLSRSGMSENALKVLYRLNKAGYEAYLVGGGVRDMLLGHEPKDFDVATNATPEEIRKLFRNCRLIGRRFRLAHVHFGRDIIEVATFRGRQDESKEQYSNDSGMLLRDNVYGTLEDDAWRRDFSVNALYYNIADFSVVDYTGGMADLMAGRLRVIGDPQVRFREDPVRMLRAVRFAAKLGFRIEEGAEQAIYELGPLLQDIPAARLFDESIKLFLSATAVETFELLRHYHLFEQLYPAAEEAMAEEVNGFPVTLFINALTNTEKRIAANRPVTPAFLYAALMWENVRHESAFLTTNGCSPLEALQKAGDRVVANLVQRVSFPKRFSLQSREIWVMQERLARGRMRNAFRLLDHPRFRAAYDFLVLRAESGEDVGELAEWWTHFQEEDEEARNRMIAAQRKQGAGKKRPRRRRRSSKKPEAQG